MSKKVEKWLLIVAVVLTVLGVVGLYLIGPEQFPNPEQSEYILQLILYPSALIVIRGIWKQTLENKISSKKKGEIL
ncbi:hypothetical protein [Roseivirga pacifica]|uniref:hypothetical protein n=1 Tax=Roseivirga pacifica TaxID=1267423 RepID=UPI00227C82CF|nr:hypothetical protein [Roseivirga pacifica]